MLIQMATDRKRLTDIPAQILDLERSLLALRSEQKAVQERLDSYKYPVLTLPNEMVSEIFVNCMPPYPLCPPLTGISSPTSLTHICRKWRAVALATPRLWRAIPFTARFTPLPDDYEYHPGDDWATRSGSLPLSITMNANANDFLPAMYPAVFYRRARWEYLKIMALPSSFPIIDGPLPALRHLEIHPKAAPPGGIFKFDDLPQLRTVVLREFIGEKAILPWNQLTSLTIDAAMNQCASILRQTTNLVHCDVRLVCFGFDEVDDRSGSHIQLPFLESLAFKACPDGLGRQFLDTLTLPALYSLETEERCLWSDPVGRLTRFIARSRCSLQVLNIRGARMIPDDDYIFCFPHYSQNRLQPATFSAVASR
ncbi:F-box domain-containing protein [Mycena sanguinolenta]|uniref:F-box domain-containing protein n=1 Tax=Mycena sanguinolenta TaxID=230812 RepID=A0A8H6ZCP6_9AGAR|nr:F-box domain-containing protein [Mycena sanguinolenta]